MNKTTIDTNESIISEIFEERQENLYKKVNIEKSLLEKNKLAYNNILISINNIPKPFTETRKNIEDSINIYLENHNFIHSLENKEFYKMGFSDAIKLIFECIDNNCLIENKKSIKNQ